MKSKGRKRKEGWHARLAVLAALLLAPAHALLAQTCTQQDPCTELLQLVPGEEGAHLVYGDELTLEFNGAVTRIVPGPDVNWMGSPVLQPTTEDYVKADGTTGIRLVWLFNVVVPMHDDGPAEHMNSRLWREGDAVYIEMQAHGDRHGGTAHYE